MKNKNSILVKCFHCANLILVIFYLYPGSILGHIFYGDTSIQPQITKDFLISSNHFYAFIVLSIIGILAYHNTIKIDFLINYLFLSSITLEFFHIFIPNRSFELSDLLGNIVGVIIVVIVYKIKKKYE